MSGDETARLAYLVLLGAVVVSYFWISHRPAPGRALRHVLLWGLIFAGLVAAWGLWPTLRQSVAPVQEAGSGRIVLPRATDGHYYLEAEVNGATVRFVVDTGASGIVLTAEDASRAGLAPGTLSFSRAAETANGRVRIAPVRLDSVAIGPIRDRDVPAAVSAGEMPGSLLGIDYLSRFRSVEMSGGRMILTR